MKFGTTLYSGMLRVYKQVTSNLNSKFSGKLLVSVSSANVACFVFKINRRIDRFQSCLLFHRSGSQWECPNQLKIKSLKT